MLAVGWDLSWGCWSEHPHMCSPCGLGFPTRWWLCSKGKYPERENQSRELHVLFQLYLGSWAMSFSPCYIHGGRHGGLPRVKKREAKMHIFLQRQWGCAQTHGTGFNVAIWVKTICTEAILQRLKSKCVQGLGRKENEESRLLFTYGSYSVSLHFVREIFSLSTSPPHSFSLLHLHLYLSINTEPSQHNVYSHFRHKMEKDIFLYL